VLGAVLQDARLILAGFLDEGWAVLSKLALPFPAA
jgi:hypothetical protein